MEEKEQEAEDGKEKQPNMLAMKNTMVTELSLNMAEVMSSLQGIDSSSILEKTLSKILALLHNAKPSSFFDGSLDSFEFDISLN